MHYHMQDPEFADLDDLPDVLQETIAARDAYIETAALATKVTKPKGGKKKKDIYAT